MIELVYYSKATPGLTSEDLSDILKTAREFNSKNDITGCLFFDKNEFLQILEGEKETVLNLVNSIKKDKRHTNFILLAQDEKKERMFTGWSMAFHDFAKQSHEQNFFRNNILAFSELAQKPTYVVNLFWDMAKEIAKN